MRYEEYAKGLWFDKESNRRLGSEACEVLNDIKEAVRRLLGEIEKRIENLDELREESIKRNMEGVDILLSREIKGLNRCKNIIKKHFAWAVGDDD